LPFIAILSGWVTAEVGRQPWVVYGVLRTADAVTPFLAAQTVLVSLAVYCIVYTFIFTFGIYYIYRLLRTGPVGSLGLPPIGAVPNRPMSVVNEQSATPTSHHAPAG
jgi:cytochrome d ubiquinol oxidase subunit I